jgi:hypothetical protein
MQPVSILASLRRHAVVPRIILAVLLSGAMAGITTSAVHANPRANASASAHAIHANTELDLLSHNLGRVLEHPAIHNLFLSRSWDSDNPANLSSSAINNFTQSLVSDGYFDGAGQYGVHSPSFTGSDGQALICPSPTVDGETAFGAIIAWLVCETSASPIPFTTLTGIPGADDNSLYVVYLPVGVRVNDIVAKSCDDFGAYHFNADTPSWDTFFGVPFVHNRDLVFAVVPAECAHGSFDSLTALASHEIIEAATDPDIGKGWIDDSQLIFNGDILKKGEASDICELNEGDFGMPPVQMPGGLLVSPYWSNSAGACVPVVRHVNLDETGLPNSVPHFATFDGESVVLPFNAVITDASTHTYSFPSPVNDPNPGIRYITSAQPTTIDGSKNVHDVAIYTTQYFLTVQATPQAAAIADASLTPSAWEDSGSSVSVSTDSEIVLDANNRYAFDHWSGDASGTAPLTAILMDGPKTATANYVLQHLLTVNVSGLDVNSTTITNGAITLGTASASAPLVVWVNDGPLALDASANVNSPDGKQYFFQGFSPAAPAKLTAPFTTTAQYETIAQLIADALANGGISGSGAGGQADAFTQQFAAVQTNMGGHTYAQALSDVRSFISHVQAQSGTKVTTSTARTFQLDALLVYHNALCLAGAAGQIIPATAAADYTFYSNLVASLGGTVLPPC